MAAVKELGLAAAPAGPLEVVSTRLGALPLINHFWDRAGLSGVLARWLPVPDVHCQLDPAVVIRLVVATCWSSTVRCMRWAGGPGGCGAAQRRPGRRALVVLFATDRASLLTELMLGVVSEFTIDTSVPRPKFVD